MAWYTLRLVVRPVIVIATVLVVLTGAIRGGYGLLARDGDIDRFTTENCDSVCWMGLEIGRTTDAEITTLVNDDPQRIPAELMPAHNAYVTITNNERRNIGLTYSDGVMFALRLTYDYCPGVMLARAGVPDEVYMQPGRSILLFYRRGLTIDYDVRSGEFHVDVQNPNNRLLEFRRNPAHEQAWREVLAALRPLC